MAGLGLADEESTVPRVPVIEVWNKWDLLSAERAAELSEQARLNHEDVVVPLSAITGAGCDDLLAAAGRLLTGDARELEFVLPAGDGQRIAWLHAHGEVLVDADGGDALERRLRVRLTPRELGRFSRL